MARGCIFGMGRICLCTVVWCVRADEFMPCVRAPRTGMGRNVFAESCVVCARVSLCRVCTCHVHSRACRGQYRRLRRGRESTFLFYFSRIELYGAAEISETPRFYSNFLASKCLRLRNFKIYVWKLWFSIQFLPCDFFNRCSLVVHTKLQ